MRDYAAVKKKRALDKRLKRRMGLDRLITEASLADVKPLAKLFDAYRRFYHRSADLDAAQEFVEQRVANGPTRFFVARNRSDLAGFVHLLPSFDTLAMKPSWILEDLYVEPEFRNAGVGAALLRHADRKSVV